MPEKQMTLGSLTKRFRIDDPDKFRLSDYDPDDSGGLTKDKSEAKAMLAEGIELLVGLQEKLYADDRWSVLIILQAMDAAGKDSVVEHVMSGLNPQGVQVHSFKQPSAEELDHDFLWRAARHLPERGRIGIFNRSHYGSSDLTTFARSSAISPATARAFSSSSCMCRRKSSASASSLGLTSRRNAGSFRWLMLRSENSGTNTRRPTKT
jgi:polyphosphate kinase 2 (PPK2 family)